MVYCCWLGTSLYGFVYGPMNRKEKITRGSHYLPKMAYLHQFRNRDNEGQVYMYSREKNAIPLSLHDAGKQRDLYNFKNEHGELDDSIEDMLEYIERQATPVIRKLSGLITPTHITAAEKDALSVFVGFQYVRTPIFRDTQKGMYLDKVDKKLKAKARDRKALSRSLKRAIRDKFVEGPTDVKELQDFILNNKYMMEAEDEGGYFLGVALKLGLELSERLFRKKIVVLEAPRGVTFLTSDHPVLVMPFDSQLRPNLTGGFHYSDIGFPISPNRFLLFYNEPAEIFSSLEQISFQGIDKNWASRLNSIQINNADRFLFASFKSEEVSASFQKIPKLKKRRLGQVAFQPRK